MMMPRRRTETKSVSMGDGCQERKTKARCEEARGSRMSTGTVVDESTTEWRATACCALSPWVRNLVA